MLNNPERISSAAPSLVAAGHPAGNANHVSILQDLDPRRAAGPVVRRRALIPWLLLAAIAGGAITWAFAGRSTPQAAAPAVVAANPQAAPVPVSDPRPSLPPTVGPVEGVGPATILAHQSTLASSLDDPLAKQLGVPDERNMASADQTITPAASAVPPGKAEVSSPPPQKTAKTKPVSQHKVRKSRATARATESTDDKAQPRAIQKAVERDVDIITAIVKDVPKR
ncbi:hypothetical protein [Denitromonas iodatirespirans]|uniref:Uncharacterized protein n=1 Tax=Denitromonas iodatirespirans TaxID=2795389 RepID=A0A944D966_DENI1|nr:hypothetical protein [Denitromonas iodatirespirans]MBT0960212.1 hypothetical protein [Denitromonas iodatirespirans]